MTDRVVPDTRFACTPGGSSIVYQVIGDGDVTIASVPPMAQNIEMAWEWPAIRRMFLGFGSFCRFVAFDKRGTGMSNRSLDIPRLDERVDELSAVLDDAEVECCYVMGTSEGGPMALMFAATYPNRVLGVILDSSAAWLAPEQADGDGDSPWPRFATTWGTAESIAVELFAPSLARDVEFLRWHQRYERNAASRDAIGALLNLAVEMDARDVLHRVECPVLMLHRVGDRVVPMDRARQTAELLRSHGVDVEMVEHPGEDHLLYAADLPAALAVIERFTVGTERARPAPWATDRAEVVTLGRFEVVASGVTVPTSVWGSRAGAHAVDAAGGRPGLAGHA